MPRSTNQFESYEDNNDNASNRHKNRRREQSLKAMRRRSRSRTTSGNLGIDARRSRRWSW